MYQFALQHPIISNLCLIYLAFLFIYLATHDNRPRLSKFLFGYWLGFVLLIGLGTFVAFNAILYLALAFITIPTLINIIDGLIYLFKLLLHKFKTRKEASNP